MVSLINKQIDFIRRLPLFRKLPLTFYRFFIVGISTFALEFIFFRFIQDVLGVHGNIWFLSIPNIISTIFGTIIGFTLNKLWSFEDKSRKVTIQLSKYSIVAIFNNVVNNLFYSFWEYQFFALPVVMAIVDDHVITTSLSKIFATAFQIVTSYIFYKYLIFKQHDKD